MRRGSLRAGLQKELRNPSCRELVPTASPFDHRLGTPKIPAIVHAGFSFRGFTGSLPLRPARLLAPLHGSDWDAPALGDFYFQAFDGSVSLPSPGYNYNSDWTPLLAGFSPAGMAASLAARSSTTHPSPNKAGIRSGCTINIAGNSVAGQLPGGGDAVDRQPSCQPADRLPAVSAAGMGRR